MTTIVIGKSGQLAQSIRSLDPASTCLGRDDIDITCSKSIAGVLDSFKSAHIINASAYTSVDEAESNPTQAFDINQFGVSNLIEYAAKRKMHFVHVSSDYVFSGDKGAPYLTNDPHSPIGVYGASKAAGEKAILSKYACNSCIIRTSWVYSSVGNNFVKTMLKLMNQKSELRVVDDQIGSPTSAMALAKVCLNASELGITGVHHFTDAGVCSWYDFALAIQEMGIKHGLVARAIPINPISTAEYYTAAARPSYSVLDKSKLKAGFSGLQPKHWRNELELVVKELSH